MEFNFMDDVTDAQIAPSGNFGNTLLTNCDNPLIGAAQFIAGIGVLVGFKSDLMLILSALFIMIMMLVAIMVRIKIKDNISDILPAIAYILLSIVILYDRICL